MFVSQELRYPRAAIQSADPTQAVEALAERIRLDAGMHFVFADPGFDRQELTRALEASFGQCVVGCTSAGEIGPEGYTSGSLVGFAIPDIDVQFSVHVLDGLSQSLSAKVQQLVDRVRSILNDAAATAPDKSAFGILLIDGLSMLEEQVVGQLQGGLRGLPLVGGSAGDGLRFEECTVFAEGRGMRDAAVLCVGLTERPFEVFKSQHFVPTPQKLVVTRADVDKRIVHTIDGRPCCAGVCADPRHSGVRAALPGLLQAPAHATHRRSRTTSARSSRRTTTAASASSAPSTRGWS